MAFRLSPEAEHDLDWIWFYIAREGGNVDIANRVVDAITDRFWLLGQYPRMGRPRDADLRPGLRSFPVGEYVIIYRIEDGEAFILRIMRGSQDVENRV